MPDARDPNAQPLRTPGSLLASLWRHRTLIAQLARREVISRYRGSLLGLGWSFFHPVIMLVVYTFVFSVVFQARWGDTGGSRAGFAVFMFVGLLLHGILAECITRGPSLVIGNTNYVKRVVFPLEILVPVAMATTLFHAAVGLVVLLAAQALLADIPATAWLVPFVVLPLVLTTLGVAWALAGIGVFVRDIAHVIQVVATVLLFMAPVFYPVSALPEPYRAWLYANPLTFIIEQARAVLLLGTPPDWQALGLATVAGAVVACAGYWCFQRMRPGFADVL